MELKKIIIHEIKKISPSNATEITLSNELIPIDSSSNALIESLLNSFKGDKMFYASFDTEPGKYFPDKFNSYRNTNRNNSEFISYTQAILQNLNPIIRAKTLARGGYFVFTEYTHNSIDFTSIFLIRDTEGKILEKTDNSYSIQTIEYLDTSNLAMACRINESKYEEDGASNYLTLTQHKQATVSDYFLDWISVLQLESSVGFTTSLYELINLIPPPIDAETSESYSIDAFRTKVYSFVNSSPSSNINLHELGTHFYNDPNKLTLFAEEHNISIDTEFRYNKRGLRKFISVSVNKDGINLKFSRGALDEKVKISSQNPNMVIIESEAFANALRVEINNEND